MNRRNSCFSLNRRQFLGGSAASIASISLRSLATGLPASFLLSGVVPSAYAQSVGQNTLILAISNMGESINCHAPGTYSSDPNDVRYYIERASTLELGTDSFGTINGQNITAEDFAQSATFTMGSATVEGARYLSYLSQDLLDRMAFIHLRTAANGHPEHPRVRKINGALLDADGRGEEEIQSAIMQEIVSAGINTNALFDRPMMLRGAANFTFSGAPLASYGPTDIQSLFLSSGDSTASEIENMNKVYDATIDSIYQTIKTSGTAAQLRYLDAHASTRAAAISMGNELGSLLSDISDDGDNDQLKAAIAMAKVNISPVIAVSYGFSGDNHNDENLNDDISYSISHINGLETFWDLLKNEGLEDQVNYATWDVFGRTHLRNTSGGRDHHNSHCINMMIGTNVNAGVYGGVEEWLDNSNRLLRATGFNSTTGLTTNADIDGDGTLAAYARTLMAYMGITEERIDVRLPTSKTITGLLNT